MTLRSFYRAVAVGTLSTLGAEFALSVFSAHSGFDPMNAFDRWPGLIWPPVVALILFLTIGGFVLWLGMIWDCAVDSERSALSKVLWLILVIPTPDLGALIYYFCVFNRRPLRQAEAEAKHAQV
jgi:Phospholipase_D-nuclease N-terminal